MPVAAIRKAKSARVSITDPHLAALLMFIANTPGDDRDGGDAEMFGRAQQAAERMLTSQPITSAFELFADRPEIYEEIAGCVEAAIDHWTDPAEGHRAFKNLERARKDSTLDRESVQYADVNALLVPYMDHALLIGACLMYRLLKGGVQ